MTVPDQSDQPERPDTPDIDGDIVAFQSQVEAALRPLHLREASPAAALRSQGFAQFACLGPIVLMLLAVVALLVVLPLAQNLAAQGYGLVLLVVVPVLLLLVSNWLGRLNRQQQQATVQRYQTLVDELMALEPQNSEWHSLHQQLQQQTRLSGQEQDRLRQEWEAAHARKAAALLHQPEVLAYVCPVLRSHTSEVFTIARRISAALHPAVQQGELRSLDVPLFPMLVATLAMQLAELPAPDLERRCRQAEQQATASDKG